MVSAAPVVPIAQVAPPAARPAAAPVREPAAPEGLTPQELSTLFARTARLDSFDYFQVLGLVQPSTPADIKRAFYQESRTWHPDRFFHLQDAQTKAAIGQLYKRITEAYYFLRDDAKRRKYIADLAGPDRASKLRFNETAEVEAKVQAKKEQEEQIGTHPKGRQFFATAMQNLGSNDFASAERNLKMALTYEPSNAKYKEQLGVVQQKLHEEFKAKGHNFMIK